MKEYTSFREFYPCYLQAHQNTTSRLLHFAGTCMVFLLPLVALIAGSVLWLVAIPIAGYGLAWAGHFFFEKNKPATFRYPLYSLASDFKLFFQILSGKEKIKPKNSL